MSAANVFVRAIRVYRARGLSGVRDRILGRKPQTTAPEPAYQAKLQSAFDTRWQMISSQIDADCFSLLDIGSNLGSFTAKAASTGLWALGMEMSEELIREAQSTYGTAANCGFMCGKLDLEASRRIPCFDVMLVLSVHHHWHQIFGHDVAAEMLRELVKKTRRVMLFEGASRIGRYIRDLPDFIDNDEQSITRYYSDYLQQTVGDLTSEIRLLGKSPCVGEREPYRWMYSLTPDAA